MIRREDRLCSGADTSDSKARLQRLTARERQVFCLLVNGCTMKEAASRLTLGYATVNTHMTSIYKKLGVRSRAELIIRYRDYEKETRE